ncbi:hypothetical protein RJT34_07185 [Clitoria ternatea]|uniref:Uncharacterized protein n=1 Tax=Clitoria ternatea TaxID=43366 RepID=A0AAN9K4W3_CLITE
MVMAWWRGRKWHDGDEGSWKKEKIVMSGERERGPSVFKAVTEAFVKASAASLKCVSAVRTCSARGGGFLEPTRWVPLLKNAPPHYVVDPGYGHGPNNDAWIRISDKVSKAYFSAIENADGDFLAKIEFLADKKMV